MGNIGGLYRRGGLKIEKVAPVAVAVTEELFPGLLLAHLSEEGGICWEWLHPKDRKEMYPVAMKWWQHNGAKVGGKHIRAGDVGYWIMAMLENHIADRLPGNVRLWDEGVGPSWEADPNKWPSLWHYFRSYHSRYTADWARTAEFFRLAWGYFDHGLHGLDPKHHASVPAWVKDRSLPVPTDVPKWFNEEHVG